ncbi:putative ribonuclease H-like domain-containing protein [Tanacetum coccineum]|uniref:Ribonuclease H-like domain-containing protein n=1 Tax=Tanacetum coccineum TaxID=301880 RepID=A0ABQ5C4M1_9ASTR
MHAQAHSTNVSTCIEVLNESMKMTRRDGIILKLAVSIAEQLRKEGLEFTRECKGHKETKIAGKQESRQLRRTILVEETSCKAMVAIDWSLFDWSQVHECIIVDVLKRQDLDMLEKLKQEKESNQLKIENFDNASKRLFSLPKFDLSNSGLEEFQQPEFEGYRPKTSKSVSEDISNEVRESLDAPLVEELVSDDKLEKKPVFYIVAKIEFVRPKQQEKPVRKSVKYAEVLTAISHQGKGWPKAVNTARPNLAVVNAVRANQVNAVKASAYLRTCPISQTSRNLMEDMLPLGEEPKEGKLLVKELLKLMCDKKNSVLFIDTGCFVLSLELKLADESQIFWVFFLASKDETSGILKSFITEIENLVDKKVKIIRCDNGTKFKNRVMSEFCEKKGIKKEFSVARTPQQNGVAERRNRKTQIFKLRNRVFVVKPYNKTPLELFRGRMPTLSFMRPFGCHVTILNTLDYLGKFDGKSDEGFFVGYSMNSKAFRVYNIRTRKVEENLHIRFLEDKPIIAGDGPKWLFDIDVLTKSMNYVPVVAGTNSNDLVVGVQTERMIKDIQMSKMDVKSAFLYGKIEKEVYVCQPPGFEDPEFPDRVYKVEKELYGLHQAHRACDILLVQVYVDDIIFGSTKKELCTKFETLMHKKFQMSSMGDLTFFLGLQVTQKDDGIFFSQDKYVDEILKKFGFLTVKTASTPMETSKPLMKDENAEDVNVYLYRYNEFTPKVSHLHAMKRIFRYFKGQPKLGLWYYKDSPFDLEAYTDNDYPGASLDRKSITGGCQFLRSRLISWQCKKQTVVANSTTEAEYMAATSCCGQEFNHEEYWDFEARVSIIGFEPSRISTGAFVFVIALNIYHNLLVELMEVDRNNGKLFVMDAVKDLVIGYTPGSDEGRLKLEELMAMCTKLLKQVLDLEKEKDAQAVEILKLKKRIESFDDDLDEEDASKQGRTSDKTKPMFKDIYFDDLDDLVDEGMDFVQEKDAENQGKIGADDTEAVNTVGEGVSTTAPRTPPTTTIVFDDEDVTMAMDKTLIKMKEEKAKEKGVAIKDVEDYSRPIRSITTLQPLPTIDPKDKERDAEIALRLQAELDAELRVERERQEEASKVAIAKMFDEVQARIDANYELAARMTQEEQAKYTIEERAMLLAEFFERRKKQLAAERENGLYERQQKRIQDFTPMYSEKEAQKSAKRLKRVAGLYATQNSPKKPKVMKSAKDVIEEEAAECEKEKEEHSYKLKKKVLWHLSLSSSSNHCLKSIKVSGYILLVFMELTVKKLDD